MSLVWNDDGDTVWALSVCHDDGSHFSYEFEAARRGCWSNHSDAELCPPDSPAAFDSLKEAKEWAENVEKGWIASAG